MRRALLTLSGLQAAAICVGSVVLPRFGRKTTAADRGNALHEYNALRGAEGRAAADEAADEIADRWGLEGKERAIFFARARSLDLRIPEGALYELPLCLRADGTVERVEGGHGSYEVPDDTIVAGTLDIVFADPGPLDDGRWCPVDSVLWTPDLKTGSDAHVAPVEKNWQARASALLGAKWTGAETVMPAIVYPGAEGGTWDFPMRHDRPAPLRAEELSQVEQELRALAASAAEQKERVERGQLPRLTTGAHCTYCAARPGCPAHVSEARALATGETGLVAGPLTREQAVRLAGMVGPATAALAAAKSALQDYVLVHGPIALPDGREYGPVAEERQSFNVRPLYEALRAEVDPLVGEEEGARLADLAFKATKDGVYEAIGAAHDAAGVKRQKKAAFERITSRQVRASRPQDGEPAEVVAVVGVGDELRVDVAGHSETLSLEDVEARWPIVLQRVAEKVAAEKWTAHYPKAIAATADKAAE